jgi:membrane protease subunit (stomatin/prohibitin family)
LHENQSREEEAMQQTSQSATEEQDASRESTQETIRMLAARCAREQPCPQCGYPMSDLKGGREAICPNCGFKDSCCY